jgi:cytidyltransferase-like protein
VEIKTKQLELQLEIQESNTIKLVDITDIITYRTQQPDKIIGLVVGCFDIIHHGHVELLEFAKTKCDILLVGLDCDESIKLSKGEHRPIFTFKKRAAVLSAISAIDKIFQIPPYSFGGPESELVQAEILTQTKPHIVVTAVNSDLWWENKKRRAEAHDIKFIPYDGKVESSSSMILEKLTIEI